jgi:hypothetical protein
MLEGIIISGFILEASFLLLFRLCLGLGLILRQSLIITPLYIFITIKARCKLPHAHDEVVEFIINIIWFATQHE